MKNLPPRRENVAIPLIRYRFSNYFLTCMLPIDVGTTTNEKNHERRHSPFSVVKKNLQAGFVKVPIVRNLGFKAFDLLLIPKSI